MLLDHYRTLQVMRDAEPEVIEKAYRALCFKHHPDRVPEHKRHAANERMKRINEAYRVLSDPSARRTYDRRLPPGAHPSAWDQFMSKGLVGLFLDRVMSER